MCRTINKLEFEPCKPHYIKDLTEKSSFWIEDLFQSAEIHIKLQYGFI